MKIKILLFTAIISLPFVLFSQDSTKVQIKFITSDKIQIPVFKIINIGEIQMEGYDYHGFNYQQGTLTKKEFLFNAPNTISFKKDTSLLLEMENNNWSNNRFYLDTRMNNQTWLLTPPGKNIKKGRNRMLIGFLGIIYSTVSYAFVAGYNWYEKKEYESKSLLDHTAKKPENLGYRYLIPTFTLGVSILTLRNGKRLYEKNRPKAERIE